MWLVVFLGIQDVFGPASLSIDKRGEKVHYSGGVAGFAYVCTIPY